MTTVNTPSETQPIPSKPYEPDNLPEKVEIEGQNRLAFFVFLATLMGSLLGIIADAADATTLVGPILDLSSPKVIIAGSNTILGDGLPMASQWEEGFIDISITPADVPLVGIVERQNVKVSIEGGGSGVGFKLAQKGDLHLLAASEPIPGEVLLDINNSGQNIRCAAEIGYDVIAFVTDMNNDLTRPISTKDMSRILANEVKNWSELGGPSQPVVILARQDSGTTDIVLKSFTGDTEYRSYFVPCPSNDECLNRALSTPGSLFWVSSAWLRTQPPRYLKTIPIQRGALPPVNPLADDFDPNQYPTQLLRPLYMYVLSGKGVSERASDQATRFLSYVRGVQGQKILEDNYFYTYFDPPSDTYPELPEGFGMQSDGQLVICK